MTFSNCSANVMIEGNKPSSRPSSFNLPNSLIVHDIAVVPRHGDPLVVNIDAPSIHISVFAFALRGRKRRDSTKNSQLGYHLPEVFVELSKQKYIRLMCSSMRASDLS